MSRTPMFRLPLLRVGLVCLLLMIMPSILFAGDTDRGELVDGVVAVIGSKVVSRTDLANAMAYQATLLAAKKQAGLSEEDAEKEFARLQLEVRDNLVDNTLILLAAEEGGMSVSDHVEKQISKVKEAFAENPEQLQQFLASRGYRSIEDYKKGLREELLRQRIVMMKVRPRSEVTLEEVQEEFEKRYQGKPAAAEGCDGALVPVYYLEQMFFPLPKEVSINGLIDTYVRAYKCYLGLKAGKFAPPDVPTACADGGAAPGYGAIGDVDETKSFEKSFQDAFDGLASNTKEELSEPFIGKDGVRILRIATRRKECYTDKSEITRLVTRLKGKLEDRKFEKAMQFWLKELRGRYRVDVKPLDSN